MTYALEHMQKIETIEKTKLKHHFHSRINQMHFKYWKNPIRKKNEMATYQKKEKNVIVNGKNIYWVC